MKGENEDINWSDLEDCKGENDEWDVACTFRDVTCVLSHAIIWNTQRITGRVIKHTILLQFLSAVISFVGSKTGIFKCFLLLK